MGNRYLFRGQRVDNGKWIKGGHDGFMGNDVIFDHNSDVCVWHDVIPETVGQCIGLKDKNKTFIFEGDKVSAVKRTDFDMNCQTFNVKFVQGCFMFDSWNAHEFFNKFTDIEVIGNIYEIGGAK